MSAAPAALKQLTLTWQGSTQPCHFHPVKQATLSGADACSLLSLSIAFSTQKDWKRCVCGPRIFSWNIYVLGKSSQIFSLLGDLRSRSSVRWWWNSENQPSCIRSKFDIQHHLKWVWRGLLPSPHSGSKGGWVAGYIMSLRSAWVTWDPVSMETKQNAHSKTY